MKKYRFYIYLCLFCALTQTLTFELNAQSCDPNTPTFTFDLTGNPDSIWISPTVVRDGLCCGLDPTAKPPIRCVEFFFTLDSEAEGIRFDIASGAIPPGALGYQIGCGPVHQVGEVICVSGPGPHRLTFCKPGNNPNTYSIASIAKPKVSAPSVVSDACTGMLTASGYNESTITWTSVPFNATYNSYLSCQAGCDTTIVTYQIGAPPFVDYQVSGFPFGGCSPTLVVNTTRIYFVNDKSATIQPQDPVVCFGGTNTTIAAFGTGGAPPYKYLWSTGETTQSIDVGVGTYWVEISDSTSCPKAYDTVTVTAFLSPIVANAGADLTSCVNNPSVLLNGSVQQAEGGIWSGGNGTFSPDNITLNATYTPTPAEVATGTVTLTLTTTGNRNCPPSTDQTVLTIVPSPIVNAGADRTVCGNNASLTLNGSVSNAGGGIWSGGTGTFLPNANSLNASYTPSAAEILAGTVTLTLTSTSNGSCIPVSDQMTIAITSAPTANAGPDQPICFNNATASLNGIVTVATGGTWSGGAGAFSPNSNTLNASYVPSLAERTAGNVTLTLTTTGNGNCLPVSDQILITITPAPTVNAGPDQTICANNSSATLSGAVSIATGGVWSGGTGTFSPNASTLGASYIPSATEITAGSVTLTLTTTGNGTCLPVTDRVVISITPAPTINAGPDRTVCANNSSLTLNGSVTVASGGVWSGGAGTFTPNASTLNASYIPSAGEIALGSVTLTLTTTGNGNCNPVSDQMLITITPAPTVNAGTDQPVCFNNARATLSGSRTVATGAVWSGGAGLFSPSSTALNAVYFPTATERTNGSVTLTLTTTGNGNCLPVSDQVFISITPAPTVDAGPDQPICANNATAILAGVVTVASGGAWTGGTGTFSPNRTTLGASYTPSATEISNGSVTLTLTSTGNGNCIAVTDRVVISITPAPTVNAGSDQSVCSSITQVDLNGAVTIATGGSWTSSGSGSFSPNANTLNATYIQSAADEGNGSVTLTLTTTGIGNCLPLSDQVLITFSNLPTADAGPAQTVCTNNFPIQLNAIGNAGVWSGGTGTFNPNPATMNATYTPSATEISSQTVTLTFTTTANGPCAPTSDNVTITIPPGPTANAGSSLTVCADTSEIKLTGSVAFATGGIWTTSGSGTFFPKADSVITFYRPSAADTSAGTVTLTLTSTGNISCNPPAIDQIVLTITPAPTLYAGLDLTVCADDAGIDLSAVTTIASSGIWSSSGTGTFTLRADSLATTYILSDADTAAHFVRMTFVTTGQGMCKPLVDEVDITITPEPIVNAGIDQTVCADSPNANLNGSVVNATGGVWSTSGTGVFSPNANTLNAQYFPSANDRATGTVNLVLTSTGNGNCNAVSGNSLILSITPAPTANAGADQIVCADTAGVQLNGILTVATRALWTSSGTGSFAPNDSSLNAVYIPSASDISGSTVILTLTTRGSENCINVSDQKIISITPAPTANAGPDQTVCANNASLILNGSVTIASGGTWLGGTGTFSPDRNNLNATYTPSASEILNGSVILVLESTGNGDCKSVRDSMTTFITPAPEAEAGIDQVLCLDQSNVALSGTVTIATGGSWSSSGTGSFSPTPSALTTTYIASSADKADTITLILTTSGNGNCLPVKDTMLVSFSTIPTVDAGPANLCADDAGVQLNGSVTIATTGVWTSSGTGSFSPSNTILNPVYLPSATDRSNGSVTLTLTATTCRSTSDQVTLTIIPAPVANAGNDQVVCANNSLTTLTGSFANATNAVWTSSGSGSFTPSSGSMNPTYSPSAADIVRGFASIALTTTGNGNCRAGTDTVIINITPAPTVNAGSDQTVCADVSGVSLNGAVTVAGGGTWTSSGDGNFTSANSLATNYTPSSTDLTNGTVTLTLTTTNNGLCNPVTDLMNITITPAPTINAGQDITACEDVNAVAFYGSVTTATGGSWSSAGTGTFNNPNQLQTIYTITTADKTNGSVRLVLTSTGNGTCMPVRDTTILFLTSLPTSNAGIDQTVCNNNTGVLLSGSVTGASGGTWSTAGSGSFTPLANQLTTTYVPSAADTSAGIVTLTFTTNVIGGCSVYDTMDIRFIDPLLNLPPHYCFEQNLSINSNPVSAPASGTFQWYLNNASISGANNATLVVNQRGIYKVGFTFDQCTVYDSTNITLPQPLESEDKLICQGGSTTISTSVIPKATYEWRHQGIITGGNSNTLSLTDGGDSTYTVMVVDSLLCIARDTIYVGTIPPPILTLINIPSCEGNTITLNAVPSNLSNASASSYEWFKNGSRLSNDTLSTLTVNQTATYSVIYRQGECSAQDASTVTFYPLPVSSNNDFVNFCKETDKSVSIDAGPAFRYEWIESGNTLQNETVMDAGTYQVRIFNEHNCFVMDSILVRDVCPPRLFVPTVFSPNGDGKNDFFDIPGIYFKNFKLTIFNRWGEIIFYTEDKSKSWDGKYREVPMPIGVYAWVLTYEGEFKEYQGPYQLQGSVTITR